MTIEEYNKKYHDIDPFALGKNIYTLEPIPDYDLVPQNSYRPRKKRELTDEERKEIGNRLKNSHNRK